MPKVVGASARRGALGALDWGSPGDVLHPDFVPDSSLVGKSARRLFETLNPHYRVDQEASAGTLAIYDWEVAKDTNLDLETVRGGLRALNDVTLQVHEVSGEHRVTGLLDG